MSEPDPQPAFSEQPPQTGNRLVDQAMAELASLAEAPLEEHHDRLAAAQDVLTSVLEDSRGAVQTPIPGVLRPGHHG
ncbi:hypothetical protein [Luteococcus peritonei]|uniref:Uncharacterized protein n=1 Tax=Luteococcus peritonei TaxID=88874 RepID=A0ABW4RUI0_9ACTN